jgi:hypothetical protein
MNLNNQPFQLDGCECRIKFDPVEMQTYLHQQFQKQLDKNRKYLQTRNGELAIDGRFILIDGGNYAFHLMLAFLGKAILTCHVRATVDGKTILDEPFTLSAVSPAWSPPKSQLKADASILAGKAVKKIIAKLKADK